MGDPLDGRRPTSARRPGATCATSCTGRSRRASPAARGSRLGCEVPAGPGAFYPPSVLADVRPGMPAFDEELFGPVAAVVPAKNEKDAIRLANQSAVRPRRRRVHP